MTAKDGPEMTAKNMVESFVGDLGFPCVGAKTALAKGDIATVAARDLRCPADDVRILSEIRAFADVYEREKGLFRSLVITFAGPTDLDEDAYEKALWSRLQALHDLDHGNGATWDPRVSADPNDPGFSLSFCGRAFYIVGLHPHSSRRARRFEQPAIVMNLHEQFEQLRASGAYDTMRNLIRRRDKVFSGSINPMLADFGHASESRQYSGRAVPEDWQCPFKPHISH